MTPSSATLTAASPSHVFNASVGSPRFVGTSGEIGAGTIKIQHKVTEADDWVDNPNLTFTAGTHLAGVLTAVAILNRITVEDADGTTLVHVQL